MFAEAGVLMIWTPLIFEWRYGGQMSAADELAKKENLWTSGNPKTLNNTAIRNPQGVSGKIKVTARIDRHVFQLTRTRPTSLSCLITSQYQ
jgi:hypothetical protein